MKSDVATATGALPEPRTKIVVLPFGQYEVVIRQMTDSGTIIGVEELRIKKQFLSPSQIGSVDDSEYYLE